MAVMMAGIFWLAIIFSLTAVGQKIDSESYSSLAGISRTTRSLADDDKLKVTVYYETLCPDSVSFITYQLVPAWGRYRAQMDLKLVPFGKSYIDESNPSRPVYHCQHGRKECTLNILHGCILDKLPFDKAFAVVGCLMQSMRTSFDKCIVLHETAKAEIQECARGNQGAKLYKRFSDETNRVATPLSFVPTIEVNGVYDIFEQDQWLYRFDRTFRQEYGKKFNQTL
ncbi:GILT-like protein 3 [Topomyia yanbarensis]|uniref:GILT-like protein 3 n=1 Tax=Topomyia yanbarensis TaxID=2498891 RepID=UPI00273BD067|nr:GILT-like protein 3 [Topomyia yanbarensis]XP_058825800.1 GILT-like protein 3 [Topomyia yanbarensis]XP_058825801.1 GILT-like protein 3 [Topomyia yanbarensis]XP_058825803.1 GILT-like protein 3 [Topomyia yanbarensis]